MAALLGTGARTGGRRSGNRFSFADLPARYQKQVAVQLGARISLAGKEPGGEDLLPQQRLWLALSRLPGAESEFKGAVPGRRFRIDIAFPSASLAVEVDGWQHHGRHKSDFTRDRERQNLLTLNGWRILRFSAGQIHADLQACVRAVQQALQITETQEL